MNSYLEFFGNHNSLQNDYNNSYAVILQSLRSFFESLSNSINSPSPSQYNSVTIFTRINGRLVPKPQENYNLNEIILSSIYSTLSNTVVYFKYHFFVRKEIAHVIFRLINKESEKLIGIIHLYYFYSTDNHSNLLSLNQITPELFTTAYTNRINIVSNHNIQGIYSYYLTINNSSISNRQYQCIYYHLLLETLQNICNFNETNSFEKLYTNEFWDGYHEYQTSAISFIYSVKHNTNNKHKFMSYYFPHDVEENKEIRGKLCFINGDIFQSMKSYFSNSYRFLSLLSETEMKEDENYKGVFYVQQTLFQYETSNVVKMSHSHLYQIISTLISMSNPTYFLPFKKYINKQDSFGTEMFELCVHRIQSAKIINDNVDNENVYQQFYYLYLPTNRRLVGVLHFSHVPEFSYQQYFIDILQEKSFIVYYFT